MKSPKTEEPIVVKSFFDIVNILLEKKQKPSPEDIKKHCNQFMLNQMFSCEQSFTGIAHEMSKLKITNEMYFDCLYNGLPKMKKFIKWNASKAKKEQDVQYISNYYKCSVERAKEYSNLISDDEIQMIRDFYEKRGIA